MVTERRRQASTRSERGTSRAPVRIGLGGVVFTGLLIVGMFLPEPKDLTDLAVGECFALPSDSDPDEIGTVEVGEDCEYRVTARIALGSASSAAEAAVLAREQCFSDVVFAPLEDSWADGARIAICAQTQP